MHQHQDLGTDLYDVDHLGMYTAQVKSKETQIHGLSQYTPFTNMIDRLKLYEFN